MPNYTGPWKRIPRWPSGMKSLLVPYVVPSLNKLFGMSHWERNRERIKCQLAFKCALLRSGQDSLIQTTSAEAANLSSIASSTAEPSKTTILNTSNL